VEGLAQKFRDKGATTPEKALSPQELDVHERFQEAMKRRLGQTGIFVEVGGRYYLNEERLREFEQRWQAGGTGRGGPGRAGGNWFALRIVRMVVGVTIIVLVLGNYFTGRSLNLWYLIVVLLMAWIVVSVAQIFFMARRRF
jgi:small-conductance mechanosensitive channel